MNTSIFQYLVRSTFLVMLLAASGSSYAESVIHTGKGTFYNYAGGGNCSLPVPTYTLTAAMNATDYANSAACGGVIKVTNTDTGLSVTVRVDDQCPECAPGSVDLDQKAFAQIANIATGIIPISWQYVANDQAGNIKLYFDASSSQWWNAVQVRDHLYPLSKLEYRLSGSGKDYMAVAKESHNYFVAPNGMGLGPFDFRLTDLWGQIVEVKQISFILGTELDTGAQFAVYKEGSSTTNTNTPVTNSTATTGGGGGVTDWSILLLGGLLARRLANGTL